MSAIINGPVNVIREAPGVMRTGDAKFTDIMERSARNELCRTLRRMAPCADDIESHIRSSSMETSPGMASVLANYMPDRVWLLRIKETGEYVQVSPPNGWDGGAGMVSFYTARPTFGAHLEPVLTKAQYAGVSIEHHAYVFEEV